MATADDTYAPWQASSLGTMPTGWGNQFQWGQTPTSGSGPTASDWMQATINGQGQGAFSAYADPSIMRSLSQAGYSDLYGQQRGQANELQALGLNDPSLHAALLSAGRQSGGNQLLGSLTNARLGLDENAQNFVRQAMMGQYGQEQENWRFGQAQKQQASEFGQNLDFQKWLSQHQIDLQNQQRNSSLWGQIGSALVGGLTGLMSGGPAGAAAGAVGGLTGSGGGHY